MHINVERPMCYRVPRTKWRERRHLLRIKTEYTAVLLTTGIVWLQVHFSVCAGSYNEASYGC